jgi:hypothetical protein
METRSPLESTDPSNRLQLDIDEYYGFMTFGDIRELSDGDFVLSGKAAYDRDAALLRIRPDGTVVFAKGYGGPKVEIFTDAHEMHGGDLFASGATTTWTHGPVDEYLVRTLFDGMVPGCEVYDLNLEQFDPGYRERYTEMVLNDLDLVVQNAKKLIPPKTVVKLICPTLIIVHPWPWDWFVRSDFNRDPVVDMSDAIFPDKKFLQRPSGEEGAESARVQGSVVERRRELSLASGR